MASNVSLSSLRLQARQRADMVNSKFISDDELNSFVNASIKDLYDRLTSAGEFYNITSNTISISASVDTYPLPSNFYKLLGVDLVIDPQGNAATLKPFQFAQRNSYLFTPTWNVVGLTYLRYMIQGDNIKFVPIPSSATSVKVWYVPAFDNLTADDDEFNGINGWEEYVIIDAAIKMLIKEESDPQALMVQKNEMIERLNEMRQMRDIGMTARINDVSRTMPWEFWSFGIMN